MPFEEAVEVFDVKAFVDQASEAGAGHVLFTSTHSKHHFCCPNPEVDKILGSRTCQRDLLMELADGLAEADIRLMVYYHHGVGKTMGEEWQEAVGARRADPSTFYENWIRIVGWMGEGAEAMAHRSWASSRFACTSVSTWRSSARAYSPSARHQSSSSAA